MGRIKLTKNELKKQKDALSRFKRYLPTLQLKKQQLQMEIRKIDQQLEEVKKAFLASEEEINLWVELFCEEFDFNSVLEVKSIRIENGNIAGIDIPLYEGIEVEEKPYNLFKTPLWIDKAVIELKNQIEFQAKMKILDIQKRLLGNELRTTSQRVNLFEKVKIIEAKENIRMIKIYLGDQQTAAVVRGKISKKKIEKVS